MVHSDIPHIRVDVSASPLVTCFQQASTLSNQHFFSNLSTSGSSTSEENVTASTFPHLYSQCQAGSSSSLLSNCLSGSSLASSSSSILTQSTLSSSDPQASNSTSRIPATAILSLLDLLDVFDADVETQVAHVKENIKETHELVEICRVERAEKITRARRKKEAIERGTLAADSEFWCSI